MRWLPFLLLLPGAAWGFDPRGVDIVGYRLGMTEARALELMRQQGIAPASIAREAVPCAAAPTVGCVRKIEARTKDGTLTLRFGLPDPAPRAVEIVLAFDARKPNEAELVEQSVMARFGPPNTDAPPTWCAKPLGAGPCAETMPMVSLRRGTGSARILTLAEGGR